jgi:hypothetical protein
MRSCTLLLSIASLALAACAASVPEDPVFIDGFISGSVLVHCEPVPGLTADRLAIRDVVTASDSSFLILYADAGKVAVVGPDLEPLHLVTLDTDGPNGIRMPSGAALFGDTLLYIADQAEMKVEALDLQGRSRGTSRLDFAPESLLRVGDQLLITPFVIGNHPRSLLVTLEDGKARGLPIATARYRDGMINTLANRARVATFPNGRIVLAHTMMIPFIHQLTLAGQSPVVAPLPLPDGISDRYGWLPTSTVTEADKDNILVAAIAAAPDLSTGDFLYITKTGRSNDSGSEKALVRLDSDLEFLRSYLLDVNAIEMAYLARRNLTLVTTIEGEWYSCPTP